MIGISMSEIIEQIIPAFAHFFAFSSISPLLISFIAKEPNIIPDIGKVIFIFVTKKHEANETIPKVSDNLAHCLIFFKFVTS